MENINKIREQLNSLKSEKLKNFSLVITKCEHEMIGVSVPNLRKLAKQIANNSAIGFLNNNPMEYYEEVLLQGFVIGYCKLSNKVKFDFLEKFIPVIKDWSECDCVVATLKFLKDDLNFSFEFLKKYFNSELEFEKRFAIVSYMNYFLTDDYFKTILNLLVNVKSKYYYVNMAVAWALSVCFVKSFDLTYKVFKSCNLEKFTYNKTIQKCKESYRLSVKQKQLLNSLKK